MNLNYKWLGADLLVFKNKNDCMTISNANNTSFIDIETIEVDGEELDCEDYEYDWNKHPENPFTKEEMEYYLELYKQNLENGY